MCILATMEPKEHTPTRAMTFRLDEPTWERFRIILLRERRSMQQVFEDYVRRYIDAKEGK